MIFNEMSTKNQKIINLNRLTFYSINDKILTNYKLLFINISRWFISIKKEAYYERRK